MREVHPTSERIYRAVKGQLLGGAFQPGERIEAAQLAEHHGASITPVRAALHRLVGEQLVDAQPGEGFHAPIVTEPGLRDLYEWNALLLEQAWRLGRLARVPAAVHRGAAIMEGGESESAETVTERLFGAIGDQSGNVECSRTIRGLNDRLHLARKMEAQLFADVVQELAELSSIMAEGRNTGVRRLIAVYHRRRLLAVADIVRLSHRQVGEG